MTVSQIAERLGMSADGVRYHVNKLRAEGSLVHEGPMKGRRWVLNG